MRYYLVIEIDKTYFLDFIDIPNIYFDFSYEKYGKREPYNIAENAVVKRNKDCRLVGFFGRKDFAQQRLNQLSIGFIPNVG